MGPEQPRLTVTITPRAWDDLSEIWDWNAATYGSVHASGYVEHLVSAAERLGSEYRFAGNVNGETDLFYITVRRGSARAKHGHVIIFQIIDGVVEVLRFFHSAQDWRRRIK